jgi:hypothetical protein
MREGRLSQWLRDHVVSQQQKTKDRLFAVEQERLEEYAKKIAKETPEQILLEEKEKNAQAVNFENEFGYVSDARIDDLAITFEYWKLEGRYKHLNLTFTEYVKMVTSGRWKEYVDADDPPPTTILLKHRMRRLAVAESKQKTTFSLGYLILLFLCLVGIVFCSFLFFK